MFGLLRVIADHFRRIVSPESADREQQRMNESYLERREAAARLAALRARAGIGYERERDQPGGGASD